MLETLLQMSRHAVSMSVGYILSLLLPPPPTSFSIHNHHSQRTTLIPSSSITSNHLFHNAKQNNHTSLAIMPPLQPSGRLEDLSRKVTSELDEMIARRGIAHDVANMDNSRRRALISAWELELITGDGRPDQRLIAACAQLFKAHLRELERVARQLNIADIPRRKYAIIQEIMLRLGRNVHLLEDVNFLANLNLR